MPLLLEIRTACPPNAHEFPIPATQHVYALLCHCEGAILTGSTVNGITTARVEVLAE